MKKKLIEVALPLNAINAACEVEKQPFTRRHPRSIHIWWARRPIGACLATVFAQLVDDPGPDQDAERERLFGIVEMLVKWEHHNRHDVLEEARKEIARCVDVDAIRVTDFFAGGGSIPYAAQRLGLPVQASDLNPVAVLINHCLLTIPPKWAGTSPVAPSQNLAVEDGCSGMARDLRYYGNRVLELAWESVGGLFPASSGEAAAPIAWIWARTVACANPACGIRVPTASSHWLSKKKGSRTWLTPDVRSGRVEYLIDHSGAGEPPEAPKIGRGARFRCPRCGTLQDEAHVREQGHAGQIGQQLLASVYTKAGGRGRRYEPADETQLAARDLPRPDNAPDEPISSNTRWFSPPVFGFKTFGDLFTSRQLTTIDSMIRGVSDASGEAADAAIAAGWSESDARSYADDLGVLLSLALSRWLDLYNGCCTWNSTNQNVRALFSRQAIPMAWDFVELNPFGTLAPLTNSVESIAEVLEDWVGSEAVNVIQGDARSVSLPADAVVTTDPPYYDNIGYSDLSDFFYVWLRRMPLRGIPVDMGTMIAPRRGELVVHQGRASAEMGATFEQGFEAVFRRAASEGHPAIPLCIFYAFKQSEEDADGAGIVSTGWERMLKGLIDAGLTITATWPMRTERLERSVGIGTNALASSVVLTCRQRSADSPVTDRRGFVGALRSEMPEAIRLLQMGSIAPVDLAQASVGPGMAIFSRYTRVIDSSGQGMPVRAALGLINQVLDEVLAEQEGEFDSETRWAIKWFTQFGFDSGPFGDAETLCKATGTAINGMKRSGILESKASKVWLVPREELTDDWDPATDDRLPVWEATQHLAKALEERGERAAADLATKLGGVGETARELAYRLYSICERNGWAKEAGVYNALAVSWLDIQRVAAADAPATNEQGSLL